MAGQGIVFGRQVLSLVFGALLFFLIIPVSPADEEVTAPPKITRCWECQNYDSKGNYYSQCPMNGTVDPVRAYLGNCTGSCFTHTDDRNKKLIVRGCTASQWGLPDPLPEDGCYPWYSEIWCVCSTDGCNGVKLGVPGSKELDHHIDYNKPKGTAGDGHSFTPCWSLILVITAVSTAFTAGRDVQ